LGIEYSTDGNTFHELTTTIAPHISKWLYYTSTISWKTANTTISNSYWGGKSNSGGGWIFPISSTQSETAGNWTYHADALNTWHDIKARYVRFTFHSDYSTTRPGWDIDIASSTYVPGGPLNAVIGSQLFVDPTDPTKVSDVSGTLKMGYVAATDATNDCVFMQSVDFSVYDGAKGDAGATGDDGAFQISRNNASFMTGNVGIGTTDPYYKLEVKGGQFGVTYDSDHSYGIVIKMQDANYGYIQTIKQGTGYNYDLCLQPSGGNVGIGTTSPKTALQIGAEGTSDSVGSWGESNIEAGSLSIINDNGSSGTDTKTVIDMARYGKNSFAYGARSQIKIGRYANASYNSPYDAKTRMDFDLLDGGSTGELNNIMSLQANGNVGIGITVPTAPLHIYDSVRHSSRDDFISGYYLRSLSLGGGGSAAQYSYSSVWAIYPLSILAEGGVYAKTGYIVASDKRIKDTIVDVPDNLALQMIRDIPCRYYEYKDKVRRGAEKTIGFIAQEVAEVLPMAVSIQKDIIPNEMRNLENISWEEIIDGSNNTYKLRTDLQDISNVKYRFYVSNDASGNDEIQKEIIGNPDNTFTFDTSYNNIFCYGKEVDDFHTLDKNKLFALNFSATQELDKQLTAEKIKTATLETSVSTLKTKVASLEAAITEIQNKLG
jgi:hypothetical protein